MLKGGSAKTRSIDASSTSRNRSRQSPAWRWSSASRRTSFMGGSGVLREGASGVKSRSLRVRLLLVGRGTRLTVAVTVAVAGLVLVDAELGELLVQGVAVDAQAGGGL